MKKVSIIFLLIFISSAFTTVSFYPIDGYSHTGIKRLKRLEMIKNGELKDTYILPEGAKKSYLDIELNLLATKNDSVNSFFNEDANFQKDINALFRGLDKSYSLTVLDISEEDNIRYAAP